MRSVRTGGGGRAPALQSGPADPVGRAPARSPRWGRARGAGRISALLLFVASALGSLAHDAPSTLPGSVEGHSGRLLATLNLAPAFPPDLQKHLSNGLTNVIDLHVALLPERGQQAAALYVREVDVLYDVWEETYGVTVKDLATPHGRMSTFRRFEELRAFLAEARAVDLGPLSELGGGSWVVQTRVELNPISKELLERTREFIANPATAGRGGTPSRSVLGAMASYLLRGADPGADVHVFRSHPFTVREVSAR